MPLPVWLPYAFQAGSMVSSGIGNYLEGKNQERYSRRIMRMQQEAMRKREESERKAGMANIFFGLGGRASMQPVYEAAPEIDPYEKSGAGRIWSGIGKGLQFAGTAVSAYDTIRNTMIAQAEQAGVKAGASRLPEAISKSRPAISVTDSVIPQLPGMEVIDPGTVTKFTPVEHFSDVLKHLGESPSKSEKLFSGWFADARTEAYDRGFNTSKGSLLRDYQGKLIDTMNDQREFKLAEDKFKQLQELQQGQLNIQRQTLTAARATRQLTGEAKLLADTERRQKALVDVRGTLLDSTTKKGNTIYDASRKIEVYDEILQGALAHNGIIVKDGIYEVTDEFQNTISAFETDKLLKTLLRLSSDEALNESDLVRLDNSAESWGMSWKKWFRNVGHGWSELTEGEQITSVQEFKETITPNNLAGLLNMVHADKQYLQQQVILPQIGLDVGSVTDKWRGNLNLLGITNPEEFETNLTNMLTRKFLPNLDLNTLKVEQTGKIPFEQHVQNTIDFGVKPVKDVAEGAGKQIVIVKKTAKDFSKAAQAEYLRLENLRGDLTKVSRSMHARRSGKRILALEKEIEEGVAQFTATYGSYPSRETPIIDWLRELWEKIEAAPPRGRFTDLPGEPQTMSADEFLLKPFKSSHRVEHISPITVSVLGQTAADNKLQNLSLLAGLNSYAQAMQESNYNWGQALFNPQMNLASFPTGRLEPEFNPAMLNIAPGTGRFPTETGIARVGSAIGLGGMYSNLSSTYLGAPTVGGPGRPDRNPVASRHQGSQYLNRAREDWSRVQSGQISGRYQGAGRQYAPVPRGR